MSHTVVITFDKNKHFDFKFDGVDSVVSDVTHARRWLDDQFHALKCEFYSPTGKVLIVDKILCVARFAGEKYFSNVEWGYRFARSIAMVLDRPIIRLDVSNNTIGY